MKPQSTNRDNKLPAAAWTWLLVALLLAFAQPVLAQDGGATTELAAIDGEQRNGDPFERANRAIYRFNDRIDRAVLRPIAVRYERHVPAKVRRGVKNFVWNLREPTTIVNDLLQGKVEQAGRDTLRFLINTTFGLLGVFDVATHLQLTRNYEDFGQTLGKWGVPSGPYLVLPFLGPSNIRDAAGLIPQYMYTDLTSNIDDDAITWTIFGARAIDTRADLLKADRILETQLDPYVFLRESYLQRREADINDGAAGGDEDTEALLDELLNQ